MLVARLGSVKAAASVLGRERAGGVRRPGRAAPAPRRSARRRATPTGMELTPGGQRLVGIASQMVNLAVEAEAAIRQAQGAPELLRVVATSTIAEFVAPALVTAFTARVGPVEASSAWRTAEEMPALLQERLADVALGPRSPSSTASRCCATASWSSPRPAIRLATGQRRAARPRGARRAGLAGRRVGRRPGQRRRPPARRASRVPDAPHPGVPQPGRGVGRGRRRRTAWRRPSTHLVAREVDRAARSVRLPVEGTPRRPALVRQHGERRPPLAGRHQAPPLPRHARRHAGHAPRRRQRAGLAVPAAGLRHDLELKHPRRSGAPTGVAWTAAHGRDASFGQDGRFGCRPAHRPDASPRSERGTSCPHSRGRAGKLAQTARRRRRARNHARPARADGAARASRLIRRSIPSPSPSGGCAPPATARCLLRPTEAATAGIGIARW